MLRTAALRFALVGLALAGCQPAASMMGAVRLGLGATDAGKPNLTVALDAATLARLAPAARSVQAVVSDIQYVTVIIDPTGFPEQSQTLQKTQLSSGIGSVTFANLPAVATIVRITAYDAGSKQIGVGTQNVTVAAGTPTTVNFSIPLDPTYIQAVGSIQGNVGFTDGPTIVGNPPAAAVTPAGKVLRTIPVLSPQAVAFDAGNNAWVAGYASDLLFRFDPSGAALTNFADPPTAPATAARPDAIAFDAAGDAWVANYQGSTVVGFSPAGKILATIPVGLYPTALAFDPTGNLWIANAFGNNVVKLNPATGKLGGSFAVGTLPVALKIDATGNVFVLNEKTQTVEKLSSAGAVLGTYNVGTAPQGMAMDTAGNLWVTNGSANTVMKLSSAGVLLATFATGHNPIGVAVDLNGNVWVANVIDQTVTKLSPTGMLLGTYHPGGTPRGVAIDKGGSVWIVEYDTGALVELAP